MTSSLRLRLFVAGGSPNSVQARENLRAMLAGREDEVELEVIDVLQDPERGFHDGILVTPTLVKLTPAPLRQIAGNLANRPRILEALGLSATARAGE